MPFIPGRDIIDYMEQICRPGNIKFNLHEWYAGTSIKNLSFINYLLITNKLRLCQRR